MTNSSIKNKRLLVAPRNMQLVHVARLVSGLLATGFFGSFFTFKIVLLGSGHRLDSTAIIFFSAISILPIILSLIIFNISERYRTQVYFDKDNDLLIIIRRGQVQEVKLDGVTSIGSRLVESLLDMKHLLILNKDAGPIELFNEECAFKGSRWVDFSYKLSVILGLTLIKDHWHERSDGKISKSRVDG